MIKNSRAVTSNQTGIHEDLKSIVQKHLKTTYQKPYRKFSKNIFKKLDQLQKEINRPIILDSGCGTGDSSLYLANKYVDHLIIGIDKSEKRLDKFLSNKILYQQNNVILARADVIDIWRLAKQQHWNIQKHYLLYPNPWPKKEHLKRRWHGHPIFPEMVELCESIELRTNWEIYAKEFKRALEIVTDKKTTIGVLQTTGFISPFEKKYYDSGHQLYRVHI